MRTSEKLRTTRRSRRVVVYDAYVGRPNTFGYYSHDLAQLAMLPYGLHYSHALNQLAMQPYGLHYSHALDQLAMLPYGLHYSHALDQLAMHMGFTYANVTKLLANLLKGAICISIFNQLL